MAGASALFPRQQHVVATTTKIVPSYVHHSRTNCHSVIWLRVCRCLSFIDQRQQRQQQQQRFRVRLPVILGPVDTTAVSQSPRLSFVRQHYCNTTKESFANDGKNVYLYYLHTYLYYSTPSQNRIKWRSTLNQMQTQGLEGSYPLHNHRHPGGNTCSLHHLWPVLGHASSTQSIVNKSCNSQEDTCSLHHLVTCTGPHIVSTVNSQQILQFSGRNLKTMDKLLSHPTELLIQDPFKYTKNQPTEFLSSDPFKYTKNQPTEFLSSDPFKYTKNQPTDFLSSDPFKYTKNQPTEFLSSDPFLITRVHYT